jgi:GLPGLI family protein
MKNLLITTACLLLLINSSFAQSAHFITSGVVEYDKTANLYAIVDRMLNQIDKDEQIYYQRTIDQFKKTQPQFRTLKSSLSFGDNKTLFTPVVGTEPPFTGFYTPTVDQNSITYSDLTTNTFISQKKAFEAVFLVKDTTRKIKWKITDETQDVAGYTCRRANALILDSVYVVAFYTDLIPVTGGPESFTGLPGMILKLAIPHENVIWTATKVTDTTLPANTIVPPKKGKAVNNKELHTALESALKNAGPYAQAFYKGLAF